MELLVEATNVEDNILTSNFDINGDNCGDLHDLKQCPGWN